MGAEVAKEAAGVVLLAHDLDVLHDGIIEGRRAVENSRKYVLMSSGSNLGNMLVSPASADASNIGLSQRSSE